MTDLQCVLGPPGLSGLVVEIGAPFGYGGREVVMGLVRQACAQRQWVLWVNGHSEVDVLPPAWFARGACAQRLVFADSTQPIRDLQAVWHRSVFQLVVLDLGKRQLRDREGLVLQRFCRQFKACVVVVRPYYLLRAWTHTWARVRLNVRPGKARDGQMFTIEMLRGKSAWQTHHIVIP